MADIVAVYDVKPELQKGQQLFFVDGYWVVSTAGEPSPLEVKLFRVLAILDQKTVVTKDEMEANPARAEIAEVEAKG